MMMNIFEIVDYSYGYMLWGYGSIIWGFFGSWVVWAFLTDQVKGMSYSRIEVSMVMVVLYFTEVYPGKKGFDQSSTFSLVSTSGLYSALFCSLLVFNVGGLWPGFYSSTEDFIVASSYALTAWLGGNLLWVAPYWWNGCSRWVERWSPGLLFCAFISGSEFLSTLMRPVSLVMRLTMNIAFGEVMSSMSAGYAEKMLLFGGSSERNILFAFIILSLFSFLQTGFKIWELFVASFQSSLFVYLCASYSGEGKMQCAVV